MGQTFGKYNTERPREQKVFDTFENIGPTDYEFNSDHPFGSSEGDYGFGMDPYNEPRARNFNLLGDTFENPFGSSDDDYGFSMDSPFGSNFGKNNLGKIGEQVAQPLTPTSRLTNQSQFDDLYHPESAASTRFNELIAQYPQREDAGFGRKLVAAMIAAKDPKASQDFLDQPFNQKFLDWKAQIEPAQKAADLERTTNVNERQYAYQVRQAELAEGRNEIARDRAEVYRLAQMKNQYTFDTKGEYIIAMNKDTGVATPTQIKTSNLSDMDKAMLNRETQLQVQDSRNQGALATKQAAPGFDPGATENQRRIGVNTRGKEVSEDPELGKFMRADPTGGTYKIVKPADRSRLWGGGHDPNTPTISQYLDMFRYIHGREPLSSELAPDAPPTFGGNNTPTMPTRPNGPVPEGPDPDAGLPRTPMTPGRPNPDTMPEGTERTNRSTGVKEVKRNGVWVRQ